jgi:TRAP-type uncharacterized transport system substrate-binding protein
MLVVILLIILGIFWVSFHFVRPMPPRTLTMTTGMGGGSYAALGERYRQVLARNGIQLQLLPSSGSVENLTRLRDESTPVDVGFVQGGIGKAETASKLDAVMAFGSADSSSVQELINAPDIKLMSFTQAEAYTRLFPNLSHVVLPKGVLNPPRRFPPADINLLAPTTNLIVRSNLHPALVYLLLEAAVEIHGGAGWVHRAGEFPALKTQDFPVSERAERYYKSGGSVLYDYLPFWAATFVDRMILLLIPLGVVLIPLIGIMPWIYTWRNRSKYYPWYRELKELEGELQADPRPEQFDAYRQRLDRIEDAVSRIRVAVAFYDEIFLLQEHISAVRQKLVCPPPSGSRRLDSTPIAS